jgi:hypothetical protein
MLRDRSREKAKIMVTGIGYDEKTDENSIMTCNKPVK